MRSRSAKPMSTGKGMAVALGFALPLSTSLYTQQQERAQQQQEEQRAAQSRLEASLDRDRSFAIELGAQLRQARLQLEALRRDGAPARSPLCELLDHEVQMAGDGAYGRYTLNLLVAAFGAPAPGIDGAPPQRTVCECSDEGARLLTRLQARDTPLARQQNLSARDLRELAQQLRGAREQCPAAGVTPVVQASAITPAGRSALVLRKDVYTSLNAGTEASVDWRRLRLQTIEPVPAEALAAGTGDTVPTPPEALPIPGVPAATPVSAATDPTVLAVQTADPPEAQPRVYLQTPAAADLSLDCLRNGLRAADYLVPDFEQVARAPNQTQLRYVALTERPRAEALLRTLRQIQQDCGGEGGQLARVVLPVRPADFTRFRGSARPNHFELWLGLNDIVPADAAGK